MKKQCLISSIFMLILISSTISVFGVELPSPFQGAFGASGTGDGEFNQPNGARVKNFRVQ